MVFFIYIPLCLYFNKGFETVLTYPATFTFHYVSILMQTLKQIPQNKEIYIPLCLYFNQTSKSFPSFNPLQFTFHYVSILMMITSGQRKVIGKNLHSIMSLF